MPAGNRIPLFGPKMGCRFPLDPLRETASHFKGVNRDVISPNGTFGDRANFCGVRGGGRVSAPCA